MQPLIIEREDLQTKAQRLGWFSLTFIFWALYVYLWLPVITLIVWWLGYKTTEYQMLDMGGLKSLGNVINFYLFVILLLSVLLIGWARMEFVRFKDKRQRKGQPLVTPQEMANFLNIDTALLTQLHSQKRLTILFDEKNQVKKIAQG